MGNVVSSLVMYALQAAWFCQRLIDQDYRQNHGSRSKPIMGIHETDLDVFLSKCRTYYLTKRTGHRQIQWRKDEPKRKPNHLLLAEKEEDSGDLAWSKGADSLHFDNENFLSRMDQQVSLSQPDFTRLVIDKNDLDYFLSKTMELPRGRRKSDSPKTERRKRKRVYYRKRFNPREGDRGSDSACVVPIARHGSLLTVEDTDLGSCDDSSGFNAEELTSNQRMRETLTTSTFPSRCHIQESSLRDHCYSIPEGCLTVNHRVPGDLVFLIRESDARYRGDRDVAAGDDKLGKVMMAGESPTECSAYDF